MLACLAKERTQHRREEMASLGLASTPRVPWRKAFVNACVLPVGIKAQALLGPTKRISKKKETSKEAGLDP